MTDLCARTRVTKKKESDLVELIRMVKEKEALA